MQLSTARALIWGSVFGALSFGPLPSADAAAAKGRPSKPPKAQPSFDDPLQTFDAGRWQKADGWTNDNPSILSGRTGIIRILFQKATK